MAAMRAWQLRTHGNISQTLHLANNISRPLIKTPDDVLVKVTAAALNPADYKVPEFGLVSRASISYPKTMGMDFTGEVQEIGTNVSNVKVGDRVLGCVPNTHPGSLADLVLVERKRIAKVSPSADQHQAAGLGIVGLTSWLALKPYIKAGDRVFLNGGSGGIGTTMIQIAKLLGASVTVSCSTGKIELCKSLGADKCIDYKTSNVVEELKKEGQVYDHVVDNVGDSPNNLATTSHEYTKPEAQFIFIGGSAKAMGHLTYGLLVPSILGGAKRKTKFIVTATDQAGLEQMTKWLEEGKLKVMVDEVFSFDKAAEAYNKLKTGSSTGKIVVTV